MNPDRIKQTADKIQGFKDVQSGWHYGGGKAPESRIIDTALALNAEISHAGITKTVLLQNLWVDFGIFLSTKRC